MCKKTTITVERTWGWGDVVNMDVMLGQDVKGGTDVKGRKEEFGSGREGEGGKVVYFEEIFPEQSDGSVLNRQHILLLLGSLEILKDISSKDISLIELCRDKDGYILGYAAKVHFYSNITSNLVLYAIDDLRRKGFDVYSIPNKSGPHRNSPLFRVGEDIREEVRVARVEDPNMGKSSLSKTVMGLQIVVAGENGRMVKEQRGVNRLPDNSETNWNWLAGSLCSGRQASNPIAWRS